MNQEWGSGKWGMEMNDTGMKQAEAEGWRVKMSEREKDKGWQAEAVGSRLESWQTGHRGPGALEQQLRTQPTWKDLKIRERPEA